MKSDIMLAKEWMFIHHPEVIEQWGMTGHDDEFMCKMMEEYASMRIKETLETLESMGDMERGVPPEEEIKTRAIEYIHEQPYWIAGANEAFIEGAKWVISKL